MNKLKKVLEFILTEIKKENNSRDDGTTISQDVDNEILVGIFHNAGNKFTDIDFVIIDEEERLVDLFGQEGFDAIRDAEQGLYT